MHAQPTISRSETYVESSETNTFQPLGLFGRCQNCNVPPIPTADCSSQREESHSARVRGRPIASSLAGPSQPTRREHRLPCARCLAASRLSADQASARDCHCCQPLDLRSTDKARRLLLLPSSWRCGPPSLEPRRTHTPLARSPDYHPTSPASPKLSHLPRRRPPCTC